MGGIAREEWVLAANQREQEHQYWLRQLAGELTDSHFPYDHRSTGSGNKLERVEFELDAELAQRLHQLSGGSSLRLHMVLTAGLVLLLHRYTGNPDLTVGTPVQRQSDEAAGYVNTILALRHEMREDMTFRKLLQHVRDTIASATQHQNYPLIALQDALRDRLPAGRAYPFRTAIMMEELHDPSYLAGSDPEVVFSFRCAQDVIQGWISYQPGLYERMTMVCLGEQYAELLGQAIRLPEQPLWQHSGLSERELQQLLQFNATDQDYPRHLTLAQLFVLQVSKTPDRLAVTDGTSAFTYAQLHEQSNRVAASLRARGIGKGDIVALMLERSADMVIALLGVLKSGAAYLPVALHLPPARIQSMMDDCHSPLMVTKPGLAEHLHQERYEKVYLSELLHGASEDLAYTGEPDDLAYIIFTSGTTGKPKGAMVQHRNVVNFIVGLTRELLSRYEAPLRFGLVSPFEFDSSVQNMFSALLSGHHLYIVPEEVRVDGEQLHRFYVEQQIEIIDGTATHLRLLAGFISDRESYALKQCIMAGEELPVELAQRFLAGFGENNRPLLVNAYGPTETTVLSTYYPVDPDELDTCIRLPIGKPLPNQRVYIMGPNLQLQPIGVPGEVWIAGDGVTQGYVGQPELTNEKYVTITADQPCHPVCQGRLYRTGDVARWLPSGKLEFLGRTDDQVKINGLRIELGEIESCLLRLPNIHEAAVMARTRTEGEAPILCAYIVSDSSVTAEEVRGELRKQLPSYMVPAYVISLERLPLTTNGKLARKALPEPVWQQSALQYIEPRSETERLLAHIWETVLGIERIGIADHFFELGGNSLQMTTVVARIQKQLGSELSLREVFLRPTVAQLAEYVDQVERLNFVPIERQAEQAYYPVSSAQKRVYILNRFEGIGTTYNLPGVLLIEGRLERDRVEQCMYKLVSRHEALRTSFHFVGGEPMQRIHEEVALEFNHSEARESEAKAAIQDFIRPFDVQIAPLMRVGTIRLSEERCLLLFDLHHLIADGVSLSLLQHEFIRLYTGDELEPLSIQYKDYAVWQRKRLDGGQFEQSRHYWMSELAGDPPLLQLPTDYPRPPQQSFAGNRVHLELTAESTEKLLAFAERNEMTPYMLFLAALNVLLHVYTQQEDIVVGSPIAGRVHSDVEPVVGMFVNTLAIRSRPSGNKTVAQLLTEVKEQVLHALQHQEYPFEELVDQLQLERDTSRNPLFDVMLVMQNMAWTLDQPPGLSISPYAFRHDMSKVDLTLEISQHPSLRLELEYCTALFAQGTMQRFLQHVVRTLEWMLDHRDSFLRDLHMLTDDEYRQVILQFNETPSLDLEQEAVHRILERKAAEAPQRTAIICGESVYSYETINSRANQLARYLLRNGIGLEDKVGLLVDRSVDMLVALFAVLKAGAAYVPIDPEYPVQRIAHILEDCEAKLLLTASEYAERMAFTGIHIADVGNRELYSVETGNLNTEVQPDNLAYILYTSGSTGMPKGVSIEHKSVCNFLHAMQHQYPMLESDAYLLKTPYTFDVSVMELFGWTLAGSHLVILEEGEHRNPRAILRAVDRYRIRLLNFVPSMFRLFVQALDREHTAMLHDMKYILLAGEALPRDLIEQFDALGLPVQLANLYGPTEATVITTTFSLAARRNSPVVPIGRPIPNVRVYILNEQRRPLPIGVAGELYISGAGVARGYLNRPELNAECFLPDPFCEGATMYRSGDLARWLPDGNIEYIGRMDNQIKLRGFRMELGEIEEAMRSHPHLAAAVVMPIDDVSHHRQLVAYYVKEAAITDTEIRAHLKQWLPEFMIPTSYVELTEIPLSRSGKVDRNALPQPMMESSAEAGSACQPETKLERQIAAIWQGILKLDTIRIDQDFFELGGDSLQAIELDLALEKAGLAAEDLVIYRHRTIRELAASIEAAQEAAKIHP